MLSIFLENKITAKDMEEKEKNADETTKVKPYHHHHFVTNDGKDLFEGNTQSRMITHKLKGTKSSKNEARHKIVQKGKLSLLRKLQTSLMTINTPNV